MPAPKDPEKRKLWIERLKKSHMGLPSGMKGKHHSKETKEK